MTTFDQAIREVSDLAKFCSDQGWLPATAGNLSVLVENQPLRVAITRSGADKARLHTDDILLIDEEMRVLTGAPGHKPSAETSVHIELYKRFGCGSIVHVHTLYNNLMSVLDADQGFVHVHHHELLKALGHWNEDAHINIPIVPNHADLTRLGHAVAEAAQRDVPAVLVQAHGVYAWGETADAARRHLEAVEFLCSYLYHLRLVRGTK